MTREPKIIGAAIGGYVFGAIGAGLILTILIDALRYAFIGKTMLHNAPLALLLSFLIFSIGIMLLLVVDINE